MTADFHSILKLNPVEPGDSFLISRVPKTR
jgi:hypothetical protein